MKLMELRELKEIKELKTNALEANVVWLEGCYYSCLSINCFANSAT